MCLIRKNKGPPRGRPAIAHSYVSMSVCRMSLFDVLVDARHIFRVEDSRVSCAPGVAERLFCIDVPVRELADTLVGLSAHSINELLARQLALVSAVAIILELAILAFP